MKNDTTTWPEIKIDPHDLKKKGWFTSPQRNCLSSIPSPQSPYDQKAKLIWDNPSSSQVEGSARKRERQRKRDSRSERGFNAGKRAGEDILSEECELVGQFTWYGDWLSWKVNQAEQVVLILRLAVWGNSARETHPTDKETSFLRKSFKHHVFHWLGDSLSEKDISVLILSFVSVANQKNHHKKNKI